MVIDSVLSFQESFVIYEENAQKEIPVFLHKKVLLWGKSEGDVDMLRKRRPRKMKGKKERVYCVLPF